MPSELTPEFSQKAQEEAQWAYEKTMEKFYYSMLEVVFLRIKGQLSHRGLKKVIDVDRLRSNNENIGIEFSQNTWMALAEAWSTAEIIAINKISELYGLESADLHDLNISRNSFPKEKNFKDDLGSS